MMMNGTTHQQHQLINEGLKQLSINRNSISNSNTSTTVLHGTNLNQSAPGIVLTPCVHFELPIYINTPLYSSDTKQQHHHVIDEKDILQHKEIYLNGWKKKQLVEWYLEYIETQTDKFLVEQSSFNFSAIPVMYIDTPPSSMEEINRNLTIVRRYLDDLLKSNNNHSNHIKSMSSPTNAVTESPIYKQLVVPVRGNVQSEIDKTKNEFEFVLWHTINQICNDTNNRNLEIIRRNNNNNSNNNIYTRSIITPCKQYYEMCGKTIQRLSSVLNQQQTQLYGQLLHRMGELVEDLLHLDEMENRDNNFFTMDHHLQSANDPVVGVIGLIVNRIQRLENELKTIQNHWDPNKQRR